MNLGEQRNAERHRMIRLAPLMVAANAFLFLAMLVLGMAALNGGESLGILALGNDANPRIVAQYLQRSVPSHTYRICEWFPAEPLHSGTAREGKPLHSLVDGGVSQRVKLTVYGPSGARNLDTVFWIQNGAVTRVTKTDPIRAAREL